LFGQGRALPLIGVVVIILGMLMCRPSLSLLYVRLLGARGVWHGTIIMIIGVHLMVGRINTFGVPAL
jgi:hypothetical protein